MAENHIAALSRQLHVSLIGSCFVPRLCIDLPDGIFLRLVCGTTRNRTPTG